MPFNVLIAEPDSASRTRLLSILSTLGATSETVESLPAACARMAARRYDLVFADLAIGDSDGLVFGELIASRSDDLSIVFTCDRDNVQARARARDLRALGFLSRPYHEAPTANFVRRAMAQARSQASAGGYRGDPPRILMYSHDSIGLGHMRRNANIAEEVLRLRPDASVLMLVGSPAGLIFDLPPGVDYVKLPSLVKLSRDEWRPDRLGISGDRLRDLRDRLIRETIAGFEPDLILVDHMPSGVWSELSGILSACRRASRRPDIVLGLRDILDSPEATRKSWHKAGADRAIAELYDEIFIYGEKSFFDTARVYGLDTLAPGRVSYAGYVAARGDPAEAASIRTRLAAPDHPLALLSGGGGRDAFPVLSAALTGLAALPEARRPQALVVAGPLMAADLRAHLRRQSEAVGAIYRDRVSNFPTLLAASDFLLGMGGYNSMIEAAVEGVPTLVVPRCGPSAEQLTRARIFAAHGLAEMLLLDEATPQRLQARLSSVRPIDRRVPRLGADGAQVTAARIVERIEARSGGEELALAVS